MAERTQRIWGRAGATPDAMEQFRSAARADLNVGDLEEEDPAVFDRLGQISVPSSLMVGDADFPPAGPGGQGRGGRGITGCELVLVHGMDHLPPLREPDLVLQTIADTLARASWLSPDRGDVDRGGGGHGPFGQRVLMVLIFGSGRAPRMPWAASTPTISSAAPASSAGPGASPSSAHELASATTGASSTHGTTWPEG